MVKITSKDNPRLKYLEKLVKQKKFRKSEAKFVIENWAIISDALEAAYNFEELFVSESFLDKHEVSGDYYLVDNKLNKNYSSLDTAPGVAAIYKIKENKLASGSVIYLNAISDPGNLGTILRSALAFGFKNIVLDKNCVDLYSPKVLMAAKDAIFKLNIIEDKNNEFINNTNLAIYATSSHLGNNLSEFKIDSDFCLVLGNESHGVDQEILEKSKANIKIEISSSMESLNVASAAAILLYELRR